MCRPPAVPRHASLSCAVAERLPTGLVVSASIRRAAQEGVAIMVRHRGEETSGAVLLKINRLDGTARILAETFDGERRGWSPLGSPDWSPDAEVEARLERELALDPDLWLLEIEDRQGRHWFPEPVLGG